MAERIEHKAEDLALVVPERPLIRLAVAYSRRDMEYWQAFLGHLERLQQDSIEVQDLFELIHSCRSTENALESVAFLVVLLSPDFIAEKETPISLDQAKQWRSQSGRRAIPILIRPCLWENEFDPKKILPKGLTDSPEPISASETQPGVWTAVVEQLQNTIRPPRAPVSDEDVAKTRKRIAEQLLNHALERQRVLSAQVKDSTRTEGRKDYICKLNGMVPLRMQEYAVRARAAKELKNKGDSTNIHDLRTELLPWTLGKKAPGLNPEDAALILVGEPGCGKSLLLDSLEHDGLEAYVHAHLKGAESPIKPPLPLRINAGEFYQALQEAPPETSSAYRVRGAPSRAEHMIRFALQGWGLIKKGDLSDFEALMDFGREIRKQGPIHLYLDGLDEIGSAQDRARLVALCSEWLFRNSEEIPPAAARACRMIIGCRPEGIESIQRGLQGGKFIPAFVIQILPLSDDEIDTWAVIHYGEQMPKRLRAYAKQWGVIIADLWHYPLYLKLICKLIAEQRHPQAFHSQDTLLRACVNEELRRGRRESDFVQSVGGEDAVWAGISLHPLSWIALGGILPSSKMDASAVARAKELVHHSSLVREEPRGEFRIAHRVIEQWAIREAIVTISKYKDRWSASLLSILLEPQLVENIEPWGEEKNGWAEYFQDLSRLFFEAWERALTLDSAAHARWVLLSTALAIFKREPNFKADPWIERLRAGFFKMSLSEHMEACLWAFKHPCNAARRFALECWITPQSFGDVRDAAVQALARKGSLRSEELENNEFGLLVRGVFDALADESRPAALQAVRHTMESALSARERALARRVDSILCARMDRGARLRAAARRHAYLGQPIAGIFAALLILAVLIFLNQSTFGGIACAFESSAFTQEDVFGIGYSVAFVLLVFAFISPWNARLRTLFLWPAERLAFAFRRIARWLARAALWFRIRRGDRRMAVESFEKRLWNSLSDPTLDLEERICRIGDFERLAHWLRIGEKQVQGAFASVFCALRERHRILAELKTKNAAYADPEALGRIFGTDIDVSWLRLPNALGEAFRDDARLAAEIEKHIPPAVELSAAPTLPLFPPIVHPLGRSRVYWMIALAVLAWSAATILMVYYGYDIRFGASNIRGNGEGEWHPFFGLWATFKTVPYQKANLRPIFYDPFLALSFGAWILVLLGSLKLKRWFRGIPVSALCFIAGWTILPLLIDIELAHLSTDLATRIVRFIWIALKILLLPYVVGVFTALAATMQLRASVRAWVSLTERARPLLLVVLCPAFIALLRPTPTFNESKARASRQLALLEHYLIFPRFRGHFLKV